MYLYARMTKVVSSCLNQDQFVISLTATVSISLFDTLHSNLALTHIARAVMSSLDFLPDLEKGMETEDGNPLVGLAIAAINAILYVLDQFKNLVTWCTITFPG